MRSALVTFFTPFGRANRLAFLAGFGLIGLLTSAFGVLQGALVQAGVIHFNSASDGLRYLSLFAITIPVSVWLTFCLFVNRLHDMNRTGVWALAPALLPLLGMGVLTGFSNEGFNWGVGVAIFASPVIYAAVGIFLLCFKSDPLPNRYGRRSGFAAAR
jgi:uncharacterized membrane protein YhaH (DUF805 family)